MGMKKWAGPCLRPKSSSRGNNVKIMRGKLDFCIQWRPNQARCLVDIFVKHLSYFKKQNALIYREALCVSFLLFLGFVCLLSLNSIQTVPTFETRKGGY